MTHPLISSRSQRGVAAVELAILLPMLITLLTVPIFFGIYFMNYTVAQKAAQGAARYMSIVPKTDMRSPAIAAKASAAAENIARAMLTDLKLDEGAYIEVDCDTWKCLGGNPPTHVRVMVTYRLQDTILGMVDTGDLGWSVTAQVTMRYAGQ